MTLKVWPDPVPVKFSYVETVPCRWCGTPTRMLGTKECDRCWELRTRVQSDPELARRMLKEAPK